MMAFDMGGPINKTAYTFATLNLTAAIAERQRHRPSGHGRA